MMTDASPVSLGDHPYRAAPLAGPRPFDPDGGRVPYDGQARVRLTISSGLAHARIVIDPDARDLVTIACGPGRRPRFQLAGEELALTWHPSWSDRLCGALTAGSVFLSSFSFTTELDEIVIALHPAVAWTLAIRGGASHLGCELAAGAVAGIDISGGASHLALDLPAPDAAVPICVRGGVSHLELRRPADTGVALTVGGGLCDLRLDDRRFQAIGGAAELETRDLREEAPRYALAIRGGACHLAIARA